MADTDADATTRRLAITATAIGIVSTAIGCYAAWRTIGREDVKVEQSQVVADRDYTLKVIDVVFKAAEGDARKQDVARELARTLQPGDVQRNLLKVVELTEASNFNEQQRLDTLSPEPVAAPVGPTQQVGVGRGAVAVDVFWCDGRGDATARETAATAIAAGIKASTGFAYGRLRVRPLPVSINAQPGYRIAKNLVRFEARESGPAAAVRAAAGIATGTPFGGQQLTYRTPNYISVFVCGALPAKPG